MLHSDEIDRPSQCIHLVLRKHGHGGTELIFQVIRVIPGYQRIQEPSGDFYHGLHAGVVIALNLWVVGVDPIHQDGHTDGQVAEGAVK